MTVSLDLKTAITTKSIAMLCTRYLKHKDIKVGLKVKEWMIVVMAVQHYEYTKNHWTLHFQMAEMMNFISIIFLKK